MPKDANGNTYDPDYNNAYNTVGIEHWSENVSRYSNAFHAYKEWKQDNPDSTWNMGQWYKTAFKS
jgi:hypothetical protein